MTEDGKPFCCKLLGAKITFTGDVATAWEVYQKLLSFSTISDFGSIHINFDLINNIPIEVDDQVLFWEALEIIHLRMSSHLAHRMKSKTK